MPSGLISLIVPTYAVARYLPEFLASLAAQTLPLTEIELIFVDDGSPDDSAAIITSWAAAHAPHAQVIAKANGGLASARNAGLDAATGTWVNFPDPDDRLSPNYLAEVTDLLRSPAADEVLLVATNLQMLDDDTGIVTDTHPLAPKFHNGRRVVDLVAEPNIVHLQAATAFYRRSLLEDLGLRFDHEIKPNFEDAFLTTLYLASAERPRIALLPAAEYLYRQRSDGSSLVQSSWLRPEKFTVLPRVGYLRLLEALAAEHGAVPRWAQNLVLYDLLFYFRADVRNNSPLAGLPPEVTEAFHDLLEQIAVYLDADTIENYAVARSSREMRQAILVGAKKARDRPREAVFGVRAFDRGLVQVVYHFAGDRPDERFVLDGVGVEPIHAKVRSVRFLGRVMMNERIAWLPSDGVLELSVDGQRVLLPAGPGGRTGYAVRPTDSDPTPRQVVMEVAAPRLPPATTRAEKLRRRARTTRRRVDAYARVALAEPGRVRRRIGDVALRRLARRPAVRERYRGAWLLIDRDTQAQDNAEHLYRYLAAHRPDVNAFFVLSPNSSDWDRLQLEGFRLIEHGSREHFLALLNCDHVLSSQIDHYVVAPLSGHALGPSTWRYTFLQHGVTKDDLSGWINGKPIDRILTVTPDEQQLIVGDGSPYVLTTMESTLTGFPRHDRLRSLAEAVGTGGTTRLLVMPTWRRDLLGVPITGGNERQLRTDFWTSPYAVAWRELLESDAVRRICERMGWQLTFVPHPNMQDYVATSPLAAHVEVLRFADIDIQQVLAAGAVMVSDYSSLAFEMAYIGRPVVYYQFDRDAFFSGAHAYRRGDWSYARNGFGPITETLPAAVAALEEIVERGAVASDEYAARMDATFPFRDGRCCERAVASVELLQGVMPRDQVVRVRS